MHPHADIYYTQIQCAVMLNHTLGPVWTKLQNHLPDQSMDNTFQDFNASWDLTYSNGDHGNPPLHRYLSLPLFLQLWWWSTQPKVTQYHKEATALAFSLFVLSYIYYSWAKVCKDPAQHLEA